MKPIIFLSVFLLAITFNNAQNIDSWAKYNGYDKQYGTRFPIELFKNKKGENYQSSYLLGKYTLINFWSTTCEPCIEEMPILNLLKNKIGIKANLIAITYDTQIKVEKFLNTHSFTFDMITNVDYRILEQNKITRFPTSIIIKEDGSILKYIGKVNEDNIDEITKILLQNPMY